MEHKCITCGKEVQIGIWKRIPGRILAGDYFVCDECVEKVGITDKGIKGGLQVLSYSMERFVEKYNSVTGSSISANLIKETKDKQKDEERARLLESRLKNDCSKTGIKSPNRGGVLLSGKSKCSLYEKCSDGQY